METPPITTEADTQGDVGDPFIAVPPYQHNETTQNESEVHPNQEEINRTLRNVGEYKGPTHAVDISPFNQADTSPASVASISRTGTLLVQFG